MGERLGGTPERSSDWQWLQMFEMGCSSYSREHCSGPGLKDEGAGHAGDRISGIPSLHPSTLSLSSTGQRGYFLPSLTGREGFRPFYNCRLDFVK